MTGSERILEQLVANRLVSRWVTANPYRKDLGSQNAKEIADAVFAFEGKVILFSDKTATLCHGATRQDIHMSRWHRNCVDDSRKQLCGALRHLNRERTNWHSDKSCADKIVEIANWPGDFEVHLVSIVNCGDAEDRMRFPILTAPYISCDAETIDFCRQLDHDSADPFVHIFSRETLAMVLECFDTPFDLLSYLQERKVILRALKGFTFASERELIALKLEFIEDVAARFLQDTKFDLATPKRQLLEGRYSKFFGGRYVNQAKVQSDDSRYWDQLIERSASDSIHGKVYGSLLDNSKDSGPRDAVRLMTRFTRLERTMVMELAFQMQSQSHFVDPGSRAVRTIADNSGKFGIVVTMARPRIDAAEVDAQEDSALYCWSYVLLALKLFERYEYVVGIAMRWNEKGPTLNGASFCALPTSLTSDSRYKQLEKNAIKYIGRDPRPRMQASKVIEVDPLKPISFSSDVSWHGEAQKYKPK